MLSAAEMTRRNGLFGRKGGDPASIKPSEQAIHSIRCSQSVRDPQVSFSTYYACSYMVQEHV